MSTMCQAYMSAGKVCDQEPKFRVAFALADPALCEHGGEGEAMVEEAVICAAHVVRWVEKYIEHEMFAVFTILPLRLNE